MTIIESILELQHCNNRNAYLRVNCQSLEIADLTGKQHFHVMEAIRKMEPAWEKVCQCKFALTSRTIIQPNKLTEDRSLICSQKMRIANGSQRGFRFFVFDLRS